MILKNTLTPATLTDGSRDLWLNPSWLKFDLHEFVKPFRAERGYFLPAMYLLFSVLFVVTWSDKECITLGVLQLMTPTGPCPLPASQRNHGKIVGMANWHWTAAEIYQHQH